MKSVSQAFKVVFANNIYLPIMFNLLSYFPGGISSFELNDIWEDFLKVGFIDSVFTQSNSSSSMLESDDEDEEQTNWKVLVGKLKMLNMMVDDNLRFRLTPVMASITKSNSEIKKLVESWHMK